VCDRPLLPIVGQPSQERADAARNRQKILDAANRMIAEGQADRLALDEVARMACVGVGTVYRRFGDRDGLVYALIDERERHFQAAFLSGPPPVGPGAPPAERIRAFLRALVDRVVEQLDLHLLLELGTLQGRFSGPYRAHHTHLVTLLGQARSGGDTAFLADALLAPLNAHLIRYQRDERGMSVEEIKAGFDSLAAGVLQTDSRGAR
jgi:AcrR family transcriptional regulator